MPISDQQKTLNYTHIQTNQFVNDPLFHIGSGQHIKQLSKASISS